MNKKENFQVLEESVDGFLYNCWFKIHSKGMICNTYKLFNDIQMKHFLGKMHHKQSRMTTEKLGKIFATYITEKR